jgi:two-component system, OmpR family, phosphate regulon response regulator PhoB
MNSILVVEDDAAIRQMLVFTLKRGGYTPMQAATGEEAHKIVHERLPRLVLLDRMLPDSDGLELLRAWRRLPLMADVPVVMLTARAEELDRIEGLSSGADDYVTKPFSGPELLLRIGRLLRRHADNVESHGVQFGGLHLDRRSVRVTLDGHPARLGAIEFKLLNLLASNVERVYTRGEIIGKVWSKRVFVDPRTVDVHVRRLRKVLETGGYDEMIQTVRGTGYRFSPRRA